MKRSIPRLTQPLIRRGGELKPATWEEAMERVIVGLNHARENEPERSFGMFSCSKATNEVNYMAMKFVRAVMGSNNIDSCNRT